MTKLSPAAQAVLDAYRSSHLSINNLAAALRAAADQVVPDEPAPTGMRPAGDVYSSREIRRRQRQGTRSQLLAIAAELEGAGAKGNGQVRAMWDVTSIEDKSLDTIRRALEALPDD